MNIDQFWDTISDSAKKSKDFEGIALCLVNKLATLDLKDIALWGNIFIEYWNLSYKSKLWAAAYVIEGGCSDDAFMDFRAGLITLGKKVYMNALADPDSLADLDIDCFSHEMLNYVGKDAYNKKINYQGNDWAGFEKQMEIHPLSEQFKSTIVSEITYAEDIDAEWGGAITDDELQALVPRLCRKYS